MLTLPTISPERKGAEDNRAPKDDFVDLLVDSCCQTSQSTFNSPTHVDAVNVGTTDHDATDLDATESICIYFHLTNDKNNIPE